MVQIKGKIPVSIHPLFWLTAALIGFLNNPSFIGILIWVFVILVSVLVHEMGHATTALFFGLRPRIQLVALGGMTFHQGDKLPFWKQFLIVLNGPLFGFMLFAVAWLLLQVPALKVGITGGVLTLFFWVNLVWTILNLVPVLPLDGGQLLRIVLEAIFGPKGLSYSLIIGIVIAGVISALFFLFRQFLIGALFALFAFQSFELFRKTRHMTSTDRKKGLQTAFDLAEKELKKGEREKALDRFEQIRDEAKEGLLHLNATEYIALIEDEKGNSKEAYDLLLPIYKKLSPPALCLLHKLSFEEENYSLVEEIGGECFQKFPTEEIAVRNALACGTQEKAQAATGWLETAFQQGLEELDEIMAKKQFDPIRSTTAFEKFQKHHRKS